MPQCIATNKRGEQCRNAARPGFSTCDVVSHQRAEDAGSAGAAEIPAASPPPPPSPPEPEPEAAPAPPPSPPPAAPAGLFDIPVGEDLFSSSILSDPEPSKWEEPEPAASPADELAARRDRGEPEEPAKGDGWGPDVGAVLGMLESQGADGAGLGVWEPEEVKGFLRDLYNPAVLESLRKRPLSKGEIEAAGRYVTPAVNRWLSRLDPTDPTTAFWGWLLLTHGPRFGGDLLRLARKAGERRRGIPQTSAEAAPAERKAPASPPPPPPSPERQGW